MDITLNHFGAIVHIYSFGESCPLDSLAVRSGQIDELISFDDDLTARNFLHRHFSDDIGMIRLRSALAADMYGLGLRSNADVIAVGASRLRQGLWKACRHVPCHSGPSDSQRQGRSPGPVASQAAPVKQARAQSAARIKPPALATATGTPANPVEWPTLANQIAQAQTLVEAAKTGVPFCAICEKLRRERALGEPA
jgi:hypothetical protein